jgi:hypothetical protein
VIKLDALPLELSTAIEDFLEGIVELGVDLMVLIVPIALGLVAVTWGVRFAIRKFFGIAGG